MSGITTPPARAPTPPLGPHLEVKAPASTSDKPSARQQSGESGEKAVPSPQPAKAPAHDPAVVLSATLAHVAVGDRLKTRVVGPAGNGAVELAGASGTFIAVPGPTYPPGTGLTLRVDALDSKILATVVTIDGRPAPQPVQLEMTLARLGPAVGPAPPERGARPPVVTYAPPPPGAPSRGTTPAVLPDEVNIAGLVAASPAREPPANLSSATKPASAQVQGFATPPSAPDPEVPDRGPGRLLLEPPPAQGKGTGNFRTAAVTVSQTGQPPAAGSAARGPASHPRRGPAGGPRRGSPVRGPASHPVSGPRRAAGAPRAGAPATDITAPATAPPSLAAGGDEVISAIGAVVPEPTLAPESLATADPAVAFDPPAAPILPAPDSQAMLADFARQWPALDDTARALEATDPSAAQTFTHSIVANPGRRLPGAILFFLAALRVGDARSWLGADRLEGLEQFAKNDLLGRLDRDFAAIKQLVADRPGHEWRPLVLPFHDGGAFSPLILYLRRHHGEQGRGGKDGDGKTGGARFVLELSLQGLGAVQLDGFLADRRFDLILRTARPLDGQARSELSALFARANDGAGLAGDILFEPGQPFAVSPSRTLAAEAGGGPSRNVTA